MSGRNLYTAKDAMNFDYQGNPVFLAKGAIVREGHPIMRGREEMFELLNVHFDVAEDAEAETPSRTRPLKDDAPRSAVRADQQSARTR